MTAQLGSIYDVPLSQKNQNGPKSRAQTASTAAGSTVRFSDTTGTFAETEGAKFKPDFKTFYTCGSDVKYTTTNKFEGASSYFSYYPTD